uniref:Parathyroid hormone n=1 Tax=Oryzias melastigma TaxID=30732 RepID=A0A3B3B521_ORYME
MLSVRYLETLVLLVFIACCITEAKPLRKRSISEMQLMHNLQEHKQVGERQDWLQEKLKKIISPSNKPQQGQAASVKSLLLKEEFKKSI